MTRERLLSPEPGEEGPAPDADALEVTDAEEPVVAEGPAGIDDVKARLAARGLLATRPAVVVPKEPRPAPVKLAPEQTPVHAEPHWAEVPADSWDVDPGDSREVGLRCPQCREMHAVPLHSTRFACPTCDRAWRWAVCEDCDQLTLTIERQESWRCGCSHVNRSWWRTLTAPREANAIVVRRKHRALLEERARVRAGMRKRRWKLVALGVAAAITAVGILVGVRMVEGGASTGTASTCGRFERMRAGIANGTLQGPGMLNAELDALHAASQGADDRVAEAIVDLRAAGSPGQSTFLMARTAVADACAAAGF